MQETCASCKAKADDALTKSRPHHHPSPLKFSIYFPSHQIEADRNRIITVLISD